MRHSEENLALEHAPTSSASALSIATISRPGVTPTVLPHWRGSYLLGQVDVAPRLYGGLHLLVCLDRWDLGGLAAFNTPGWRGDGKVGNLEFESLLCSKVC